jgi:hypothetical protein
MFDTDVLGDGLELFALVISSRWRHAINCDLLNIYNYGERVCGES